LRIYTRPPYYGIYYPYLIVNPSYDWSLYLVGDRTFSAIVDSGVFQVFYRRKLQEYPTGWQRWIEKLVVFGDAVRERGAREVWLVVPDYPSDYPGNPIPDNIERTIRNVMYALDTHPDRKWIVPLQGQAERPSTVVGCAERMRELGLLDRVEYVAVAPSCTARDSFYLRLLAEAVRRLLPDKRIHMFGVTMKAWTAVEPYVDSVDSIVSNHWCRRITGRMCSKKEEKLLAWREFLKRVEPYLAREWEVLSGLEGQVVGVTAGGVQG
jgi:hypothetical protein